MKICSVSVGKDFCEKYSQTVKKFAPKNIDLIILTDHPEYFDFCDTELYSEYVFSYFSKNILASKICNQYLENVLYVDIDSFHIVNQELYKNEFNSDYFLYDKLWDDYTHSELNTLPQKLLNYYRIGGNLKIENIHEKIFYLPYSHKVKKLYNDLKNLQRIWDNETKESEPKGNAKKYSKYGIGWGEGIPLSMALLMSGIMTKKYDLVKTTII